MRHLRRLLVTVAVAIAVVGTSAQTATPLQRPTVARRETFVVGFGPASGLITTKAHAPFSGVLVEEMQQTLNDGTNISREFEETVMRDGRGRVYRARKILRPPLPEPQRAGAQPIERPPLMIIVITDPVRHVQYMCTAIRRCTRSEYRLPPNMRRRLVPDPKKMADVMVEDLGTSNISGVDVVGQRITRVLPDGSAGNDRPFTTSEEVWHAPALDVDVQVKRTDPRMGTRTTMLTEVSLGEPDPSFFQVPEGYTLEDRKSPTGAIAPLPMEPFPPTVVPSNPPAGVPPNQ